MSLWRGAADGVQLRVRASSWALLAAVQLLAAGVLGSALERLVLPLVWARG